MSDALPLIRETVEELVNQHCAPHIMPLDVTWQPLLWAELEEVGFTGVGIDEEKGGGGGDFADAAEVVRLLARGGAAVPFAESALLASFELASAGLELPAGPLTYAVVSEPPSPGAVLRRVPWADVATHLVLLVDGAGGGISCIPRAAYTVDAGSNLADEARDDVTLVDAPELAAAEISVAVLRTRAALVRAVAISGALEGVLDLSVQYAREREQFGRPIGRFQSVQDMLATLAADVVSVRAVTDAAIGASGAGAELFWTAVAKTRGSAVAGPSCRIAHQVHGAIGFTDEHVLSRLTRRLWAWRDEDGNDREWARVIGDSLVASEDALWPTIAAALEAW